MATITAIRTAVADSIRGGVSGLRAYAELPDNVEPPAAVVDLGGVNFDDAFTDSGGVDTVLLVIKLAVSPAESRTAQLLIDDYLSKTGTRSIRAALYADPALADIIRLTQARGPGPVTIAGVDYYGAQLLAEVLD